LKGIRRPGVERQIGSRNRGKAGFTGDKGSEGRYARRYRGKGWITGEQGRKGR
jgi:hypothetical protein